MEPTISAFFVGRDHWIDIRCPKDKPVVTLMCGGELTLEEISWVKDGEVWGFGGEITCDGCERPCYVDILEIEHAT